MKWQDLEVLVRRIAQSKFGGVARAEDIAGVKCDCVIHVADGIVILIEISKENKIEKLRTDIAKFNVLRPHFIAKNIFPQCYFVTLDDPTPAMIQAGTANYVKVFSVWQLFDNFLGLDRYSSARATHPFGSAVDLYSGEPDRNPYVAVSYIDENGRSYTIDTICSKLLSGKTIVLVGDYGSGKSRCIKQTFEKLLETQKEKYSNPIAINLRENWGLKRAQEILTRHYTDLGLSDILDQAIKIAYAQATIYLLDGFDEIGAQTWSDDPTKLVEIRKQSLLGVSDLISQAKGGILIAGREHYFNNDVELIECLGLGNKNPIILYCNPQLTDSQFSEFLGRDPATVPPWMPKKPLIATIIRDISVDLLDKFLETSAGEIDFWGLLIDSFCEREAKINKILDSGIIRALYTKIGRLTRTTNTNYGPISIKQINEIFESVTRRPPTDESAIVLQRLPGLSRIGAESLDRQFADDFILDGLKAEDTLELYFEGSPVALKDTWRNPLGGFGVYFLSASIIKNNISSAVASFVMRNNSSNNKVLLSDLLSSLILYNDKKVGFNGFTFSAGRFFKVSLADTCVRGLNMYDCHFDYLDITDAKSECVNFKQCTIIRLAGITSSDYAPPWFEECLVEEYQKIETVSAIREAGLSLAQTFLLSSLRKLFFQPGGGRKSSSMYKGYSDSVSKKTCDKVIQLLIKESFCKIYKGDSEALYVPDRALTNRVRVIMSQLTTSKSLTRNWV